MANFRALGPVVIEIVVRPSDTTADIARTVTEALARLDEQRRRDGLEVERVLADVESRLDALENP